jgi:hypothetical protein
MTAKAEQFFAFGLLIASLVIGVVCFGALAPEKPEEPVRIMLKSTAGKILLDHKTHAAEDGYGLACDDCHHEEQEGTMSCSGEDCHGPESDPTRGNAFHMNCKGCHEDAGAGPVECAACHVMS